MVSHSVRRNQMEQSMDCIHSSEKFGLTMSDE